MKYLIVVDMQKDFVDGALGSKAAVSIVPAVIKKIRKYRKDSDAKIIFTFDTHQDNYLGTLEGQKLPVKHCIQDTEGWLLATDIPVEPDDMSIYKTTFGWLRWADVIHPIAGDTIEIIGLCTDICVVSNALILRAAFPDVEIICDSTCCAGVTKEAHDAALTVMRSCQIDIQ